MIVPDSVVPPAPAARPRPTLAGLRAAIAGHRPFVNITLNTLVFNIAFWMAAPLQPIYFVRELGASDGWLGIWLGMTSGGALIGNLIWPRLIDKHGFGWVLVRAATLSAAYYFLIGLVPNLTLILLFGLMFGAIQPGVDVSHFNILLEVCPPAQRALYLGVFVTAMNTGFFLCSIAAAPLIGLVGAQTLVVALGVLRLCGALLFMINPVRAPVVEATAAR